ncbi:MAG: PEP-CTERM sorting domain-containing protein [Candidatus Omnitrophota bacterium]
MQKTIGLLIKDNFAVNYDLNLIKKANGKTMEKITIITIGLIMFLFASKADAYDWSFELIPQDGKLAGASGEELIWGYVIKNNEADYWLDIMDFFAGSWQYGESYSLLDLPTLSPQSEASGDLLKFVWDVNAPLGFVNSGEFIISGDWCDADPYDIENPGSCFASEELSQGYTATCIPEPSTVILLSSGMLAMLGMAWRKG